MFKKSGLLTFYAESSLHMGAGTAVSYVDLPIQREKHTDFPIIQASGIKGVMREFAEREWKDDKTKVETIFGPEQGDKFASCIVFTDAKILLFPVRSVSGIFAWASCPFVLKRFKRDLESAGIEFKDNNEEIKIPEPSGEEKNREKIIVTTNSVLKVQSTNQVMLEEFVFDVEGSKSEEANKIANKIKEFLPENSALQDLINELPKRFCIVADNVFKDFVKLAVEIQTRIKIDQDTGTVGEGPFTEELVPSESIFYSLVFFNDPYFGLRKELDKKIKDLYKAQKSWEEVLQEIKNEGWDEVKDEFKKYIEKAFCDKYLIAENFCNLQDSLFNSSDLLQLGGDETLGRGLLRVKFTQGK